MAELLPGRSGYDRFNAHVTGLWWQGDRIGSDGFCLSFLQRKEPADPFDDEKERHKAEALARKFEEKYVCLSSLYRVIP